MVTSEEVGDDFEHVEAQKKKFDDYQKVRISFVEALMEDERKILGIVIHHGLIDSSSVEIVCFDKVLKRMRNEYCYLLHYNTRPA